MGSISGVGVGGERGRVLGGVSVWSLGLGGSRLPCRVEGSRVGPSGAWSNEFERRLRIFRLGSAYALGIHGLVLAWVAIMDIMRLAYAREAARCPCVKMHAAPHRRIMSSISCAPSTSVIAILSLIVAIFSGRVRGAARGMGGRATADCSDSRETWMRAFREKAAAFLSGHTAFLEHMQHHTTGDPEKEATGGYQRCDESRVSRNLFIGG